MALYELILVGGLFGQQTINKWTYLMSGTPASVTGAFALSYMFGATRIALAKPPNDTLFYKILDVQSNQQGYVEVIVNNLYSPVDFYTTPFPARVEGNINAGSQTPFVTAGFRTNLVRRDVGRGTKRFSGIPEEVTIAGGGFTQTYKDALAVLGTAMTNVLTYTDEGNNLTFAPVILSKQSYTTPSGKRAYKYYPTEIEQVAKSAQSIVWQLYQEVRTQRSRQYGKGS